VHVLAYWVAHRELPINNQIDISHLCHNRKCFNPQHLVRETHAKNWDRIHCHGGAHCKHEPACLEQQKQ
jgi:hypothetical protein